MNVPDKHANTVARVDELLRSGVQRKADAFERVAAEIGSTPGSVSQRYYAETRDRRDPAPAPRRRAETPPPGTDDSLSTLLDTAALMVLEAVRLLRDSRLEQDAAAYRSVRAVVGEFTV